MNTPKTTCGALAVITILCLFSTPLLSADYFWIGGSGNWADISHWATTSGGTTTHSQAPTASDDVFFDANSFSAAGQTVTFNTDINFCRSLSFAGATNAPTLSGTANVTLNIFGGLELTTDMVFDFAGKIVLAGADAANAIDFAGHATGTLDITGSGGWDLNGPVVVDSTLTFTEGTLRTNGQPVTCGYLWSDGDAVRRLELGASLVTITKNTWEPYDNAPVEFDFQPLWIDARNLTIVPGSSRVELLGTELDLHFEGPGTIDLNELVLSAPTGDALLWAWINYNGFGTQPDLNVGRLDLHHRTDVRTAFTAGTLELHPGQEYLFETGLTYAFDDLIAQGDCRAGIDLMGTEGGGVATFSSANDITAEFVSLQSIAAAGGGAFTANDAADFGNNPGWTINEKPSTAFYWIGGTGNWADPLNWSATSGGPAANCVPSIADDVFFDANSFDAPGQIVTLDRENAYCRSMDWTGATGTPTLAGVATHQLRLSGSLTFIPAMDHAFAGDYLFSSTAPGNTITSAGQPFNQEVSFSGGGEWILQDALYVYRAILVNSGVFRTNDQDVNAQFFRSNGAGTRAIYLGDSYVTIESRNDFFYYSELNFNAVNFTFDAGTSTVEFAGGNSGGGYVYGEDPVNFNVVIFTCPFGGWYNGLYDPATGSERPVEIDSMLYYNSGGLGGTNDINYCYFRPGRTYEIGNNATQTIRELDANGSCDEGMVSIMTDYFENPATLNLPGGQSFDRLFVRGIQVNDGAPVPATNSIDAGRNVGWDFTAATGRTLYWVGGDGDWYDRSHWSLASGGPGGECVPTALDDVFFDNNSESDGELIVSNGTDRSVYAHDISWEADPSLTFNIQYGIARLTGSVYSRSTLLYYSSPTFLYGSGEQAIDVDGDAMGQYIFDNNGHYTISSNISLYELNHQRGEVTLGDIRLEAERFVFPRGTQPKVMNFGASFIQLRAQSTGFWEAFSLYDDANLTLNAGTSTVQFTALDAGLRAEEPVTLYDVAFTDPAGRGYIFSDNGTNETVSANAITYSGNGEHELEVTTNDLIFAPGKAYVFAAGKTQTVNRFWQTIGNNCVPISLSSSANGEQAVVSVPAEGEILADFIQMRNITGVGGAAFLAGSRSTNIANSNVNWTFETAPQFQEVGFLGEDRALCAGEPVTLNAFNFSPGETYLWSNGSTGVNFSTSTSGTYFVEVTFETSCVIRDTIVILDVQDFEVDLGQDPTICEGETFTFNADVGLNNADYLWQDGSTADSLVAATSGRYFVTVDLGGCEKTDTIDLTVTPAPVVTLPAEVIACTDQTFTLMPDIAAESVAWQDGSTGQTFTGDQPGVYWIEGTNGNCTVRDSALVTYVDAGTVNLGPDTTVCDAGQLLLDAGDLNADSYVWQDGTPGQSFLATTSGTYHLTIEVSGCVASDTINVVFVDNGGLQIAGDYLACQGETFTLAAPVPADSYSWSNGQTGPDFATDTPDTYEVTAVLGPCTLSETFTVGFLAPPVVELGPDTSYCAGTPVDLDAGQAGTWQDGSTQQVFTATTAGRYRVVVTNEACTVTDSVDLTFLALPDFSLGNDQAACAGETLSLAVPTGLGDILWDDASTEVTREFTSGGTFSVGITDNNGCVGRDTVALSFAPLPLLELGPDTTVCDNLPFSLRPALGEGVLTWPDGSTGAVFPVQNPGVIVAVLDNDGCVNRDTVRVDHRECVFFQAYLPTGFSPNADGVNDGFRPYFDERLALTSYQFQVFGRWGELLFSTEDPTEAWDGTSRGQELGTGVYSYFVAVGYLDDSGAGNEVLSGQVTLVR